MYIEPEDEPFEEEKRPPSVIKNSLVYKILKYLFKRVLAVALTLVIGVFVLVVIANGGGMLDQISMTRVNSIVNSMSLGREEQAEWFRSCLVNQSGLTMDFLPRHLTYTAKALLLNWGDVQDFRKFNTYIENEIGVYNTADSRTIILSRLPRTMLLIGAAYLIMLLFGIPLALYLSQHEGKWIDRLVGILTPLSSIPSWVIGVLLVMVFAVQLKLLPPGKMYEAIPPETTWDAIFVVTQHMILPVCAIILSLIFQLVYGWRTYLLIYSNEDYVNLARAKGLRSKVIDRQHILRPALPYLVTNVVLTLVGFWQMITALEFFFQWPGIGKLFIDALPDFHGESMYPGEMTMVLGIVVLFAYVLAITVILLDFIYIIVDPRLRVEKQDEPTFIATRRDTRDLIDRFEDLLRTPLQPVWQSIQEYFHDRAESIRAYSFRRASRSFYRAAADGLSATGKTIKTVMIEIFRLPIAVVGLVLAIILVVTSILVVIYMPYDPVAKSWTEYNLSGTPTVAKLAQPTWVNWFRVNKLPSTIILDSQDGSASKVSLGGSVDFNRTQIDYSFDYPYTEFPSELGLYLTVKFLEKSPFITPVWITPDGREIELKSVSVINGYTYPFDQYIPAKEILKENPNIKLWYNERELPVIDLLFADPTADHAAAMPGQYTLRLKGIFFEENNDLDAKFVVFGQVEGWAGTDYIRRDLLIPLLWGLPIALLVGLVGAIGTSLISLILAAVSAWKGGWMDYTLQRATEANMLLPVMAIGVLLYSYYNLSFWLVIVIVILSNILGSSTKVFRAAFLQEKEALYIEAAQAYGASDWRIISQYLVPRIIPVLIPQVVMLIPNFIFLEATLAIFNVFDPRYPTWGRILYSALRYGALYGSEFWVLQPIALMLATGLSFVLISFALNRLLTPHLHS